MSVYIDIVSMVFFRENIGINQFLEWMCEYVCREIVSMNLFIERL